jgi:anti-sigma factor RsiW
MAHCDEDLLSWRFVSGDLNGAETAQFLEHLKTCARCQANAPARLLWVDRAIFDLASEPPPPHVWDALARQLRPRRLTRVRHRGWVAAALLIGVITMGAWTMHQVASPPLQSARAVRIVLTPAKGAGRGHLNLWADGHFVLTASQLPPLAPHQVYEVWSVGSAGPKPLGPLGLTRGQGYYAGTLNPRGVEEIVVCREPQAWVGRWMGSVVLSASLPLLWS